MDAGVRRAVDQVQDPPESSLCTAQRTGIHENASIFDRFDMDPSTLRFTWQWTATGDIQDPPRIITPLRLMVYA